MENINILVVEDDDMRIQWFKTEFAEFNLKVVKTAQAGISYVENEKFDIIFLDHDLGDRIFVSSEDPNTGYQVAKAIVNSINSKTPIVVHSYNPVGVKNILSVLKDTAVSIPFGVFNKKLLNR